MTNQMRVLGSRRFHRCYAIERQAEKAGKKDEQLVTLVARDPVELHDSHPNILSEPVAVQLQLLRL